MRRSNRLLVSIGVGALLLGAALPSIEATPSAAPFEGAAYAGDRVATLEDQATALEPAEDEPGFDCRVHGNKVCGVQLEGQWYNVTFAAGAPVSVVAR